jgi:hypothetical protein
MIIRIVGAALTGIGGHFLNKKWDKAVLFLSLFIFYCIFCWVAVRTYLFSNLATASASPDQIMQQIKDATLTVSIIYLSGILILWGLSIILTIADARMTGPVDNYKWTKTGVLAASLATLLSLFLLGYTSIASVSAFKFDSVKVEDESNQAVANNQFSHNFYEYIYLGGTPSDSHKLPEPPEGGGVLRGRVVYEDEPADGVMLNIVLNSKYRARKIVTDANGYFTVKLPIGDWKINSIQTESWQNKPDGDKFSIYYGGEAKLIGNHYDPYNIFESDGFQISVDESKKNTHITLDIKKDIELIWPDQNVSGIDAKISDAIRWKPYPLAAKYYIEIKNIRREGTTTYFNQITSKVLSNETSIPLSSLKHINTKGKENQEYAAEIYAFSDDGTLLAQCTDTFNGGTFILANGHVFIEDNLQSLFDLNSGEDPEKLQKKMELIALDRRRIEAVETLIDDELISEAEILLDLVNSELAKGRKEVLSGYILALKGACNDSNMMFNKALSINPDVCIPQKYKLICE